MSKEKYSFKVTITLEEGDDYPQDEVKKIIEDYLSLGNDNELIGSNAYDSFKVEPIKELWIRRK